MLENVTGPDAVWSDVVVMTNVESLRRTPRATSTKNDLSAQAPVVKRTNVSDFGTCRVCRACRAWRVASVLCFPVCFGREWSTIRPDVAV
jgi:hypothetical protein